MFASTESFPIPNKDILSYIFDAPQYDQDQPMLVDAANPERSISCNQARRIIRQIVAGLRASGVKPGDCVAIHSFNDIYYTMLFLGIIGAGGVFTGTNPGYTSHELAHHLKTSRAQFLISEPEILAPLLEAAKKNGIPESNLWIFDPVSDKTSSPKGHRSWQDLFRHGEQDWVRFDNLETASTTTAARLFSSGTTGLPKAVTITHRNLVAQQEMVFTADPRPYQRSRIVPLPLFHAAVAPSTHIGALAGGHINYIMRRFDLPAYLQNSQKFQVTDAAFVPPMVVAILMTPYSHTKPFLKSVKQGSCGAAPLDKALQEKAGEMLGDGASVAQVWGMTEASCIATNFRYGEHDDTGSIGRPLPNIDIKIIDDDGNDITGYDVRGEMCIRGPTIVPGYFENPKATAETFEPDGWYRSGDVGYCDAKTKKWYIVDRKKELIKVRGFQVAPPELEAVLLSHPQIVDAAVIGIPAAGRDGERPRAFVVRRPGKEGDALTEKDVVEYSGSRLAKFKALTGGVKFVKDIPKNASGKILKRILREQSAAEAKAEAKTAKETAKL